MAISYACHAVGYSVQEMVTIIRLYATRNELVHANLETLIAEGKYDDLKKQLYNDYCDIPKAILEPEVTSIMQKLCDAMIKRWFSPDEEDPDNVQSWIPTRELVDFKKELCATAQKDPKIYKNMMKSITVDVAKNLRMEKTISDMAADLKLDLEVTGLGRHIRRVAWSEMGIEQGKAEKRLKEWNALKSLSHNCRAKSETFVQMYGELGPPPELVEDPSLG